MAHYSFVVTAPQPLGIPKPFVALDSGVNTFNAVVDDVNEFIKYLHDNGVIVNQAFRLDVFEKVPLEAFALPGESLPELMSKIE